MDFFEDIKNRAKRDIVSNVVFYGPSTVSYDYIFPNWAETIRYVLKTKLEMEIGDWRAANWNVQTMNLGLDGATSKDLLKNFETLVLSKKPNLIFFVGASVNDTFLGISKEESKKNIEKIIRKTLDSNIKIVFASHAPSLRDDLNEKIASYVGLEKEIAGHFRKKNNFKFVDLFKIFPRDDISKSYTLICEEGNEDVGIHKKETDPIHCNRYGNAIMAKIILKEVFGIDFDERRFLDDVADDTKKYPQYW